MDILMFCVVFFPAFFAVQTCWSARTDDFTNRLPSFI